MSTTVNKSVSLRIVANAGTAKQTLDDITSQADKINGKRSSLTVNVKGSELVNADLDGIRLKADELGIKNVRIAVKADTAEADAKLAATKAESDGLGKSLGGTALSLTGFGDVMGAASGDASMFTRVMGGLNAATGLLEPLMAGGIVAVGALGAGLVSAGVGLGVFGLVAKSAFSTANTAATAAQTAQTAYTGSVAAAELTYRQSMATATTAAQRKAAETKLATALQSAEAAKVKATTAAYAGLSKSQIDLANTIAGVKNQWQNFVSAATPGVSGVLDSGLKLLPGIFRDMSLFLPPVEKALSDVIGMLGKNLNSGFVQGFIKELAAYSGPSIEKIAKALGDVVLGIMGVLKAFMPMSSTLLGGLDKLAEKFAKWGETLSGHSGFQSLMSMFKSETPQAVKVLENLGGAVVGIVKAMTGLSTFSNGHALLEILTPLTGLLDKLANGNPIIDQTVLYLLMVVEAGKKLGGVFNFVQSGIDGFKLLTSLIGSAAVKMGLMKAATEAETVATEGATGAQEGLDVAMDANPIGLIILAIGALVLAFYELWTHFAGFRDFWKDAWKDIVSVTVGAVKSIANWMTTGWNSVYSNIDRTWSTISNFFSSTWGHIENVFSGAVKSIANWLTTGWNSVYSNIDRTWSTIANFFSSAWSNIVNVFNRGVSTVVGFVVTMGRGIISVFSNAGSWLVGAGENIINGLWHGILSIADQLGGLFSSIVSNITGMFSDAANWLYDAGWNLIVGLWNGVTGMAGKFTNMLFGWAKNLISGFAGIFGIHSPSTVFAWHGQMMVEGLIQGLTGAAPKALNAVGRFGSSLTAAMQATLGRNGALNVQGTMTGGGQASQVNNFNINGVITDPNGTARQIAQLLNDYNRENGKELVFG